MTKLRARNLVSCNSAKVDAWKSALLNTCVRAARAADSITAAEKAEQQEDDIEVQQSQALKVPLKLTNCMEDGSFRRAAYSAMKTMPFFTVPIDIEMDVARKELLTEIELAEMAESYKT